MHSGTHTRSMALRVAFAAVTSAAFILAAAARSCVSEDLHYHGTVCNVAAGTVTLYASLRPDASCDFDDDSAAFLTQVRKLACLPCAQDASDGPSSLTCEACVIGESASSVSLSASSSAVLQPRVYSEPVSLDVTTHCSSPTCVPWRARHDTSGGVWYVESEQILSQPNATTRPFQAVMALPVSLPPRGGFTDDGELEFEYAFAPKDANTTLTLSFSDSEAPSFELELPSTIPVTAASPSSASAEWHRVVIHLPQGKSTVFIACAGQHVGSADTDSFGPRAQMRNFNVHRTGAPNTTLRCAPCAGSASSSTLEVSRCAVHFTEVNAAASSFAIAGSVSSSASSTPDNSASVAPSSSFSSPFSSEEPQSTSAERACVAGDYVPVYDSCVLPEGQRKRRWVKAAEARCVEVEVLTPADTLVPCASCSAGMQHQGDRTSIADCKGCRPGQHLFSGEGGVGSTCVACPTGTFATPVLALHDGFDGFSGNLTALPGSSVSFLACTSENYTDCTETGGTGFALVGHRRNARDDYVIGLRRSEVAHFASARATYSYAFETYAGGSVAVKFTLVDDQGNSVASLTALPRDRVLLRVDGVDYDVRDVAALDDSSASPNVFAALLFFTNGDVLSHADGGTTHTIAWVSQEPALRPSRHRATPTLLSLVVTGDSSGGGVETCVPCPPGFACPVASVQPRACAPGTYQPATHSQRCLPCSGAAFAPGFGFRACVPCISGGAANAAHTACVGQRCELYTDDVFYNFTDLAGVVLNATVDVTDRDVAHNMTVAEADAAQLRRLYFSPCQPLEVPSVTPDSTIHEAANATPCVAEVPAHNSSSHAYLCERTSATRGRHYGDVQRRGSDSGPGVVTFDTSMGSLLRPVDPRASLQPESELTWQAVVRLECANVTSGSTANSAGVLTMDDATNDTAHFTWRSPYACARCTEASYRKVEDLCIDDHYESRFVRNTSSQCTGGFEPPPPQMLPCTTCREEFYTIRWGGPCNTSNYCCEQGVNVLKPEHVGCRVGLTDFTTWRYSRACHSGDSDSEARGDKAGHGAATVLVIGGLICLVVFAVHSQVARNAAESGAAPVHAEGRPQAEIELEAYGESSRHVDGLRAHYDVVPATASDATVTLPAEESGAAGAAASQGFFDFAANAVDRLRRIFTNIRGISSEDEVSHERTTRNGYGRMVRTDSAAALGTASDEPSLRAPQASSNNRGQTLFALEDDDSNDLLPPLMRR